MSLPCQGLQAATMIVARFSINRGVALVDYSKVDLLSISLLVGV